MNKSENKGLLATDVLLLGLIFLGYYGYQKEESSINTIVTEDDQLEIHKGL